MFGALKARGRMDVPLPHGPDFFQFSEPATFSEVLRQLGFVDVAIGAVPQFWELRSPRDLLGAILEGAARLWALLKAQHPGALAAIEAEVEAGMDRVFRDGGRYLVPMPALVGSGTKRK